ncbi:uncharacterized protein LOC116248951 isoform X1 [Nymphaea colorata]|nr:uncharacterized protein LOC116248951 isoform X1 [Nymphaea colorata]XP_031477858.1 uncharacterized protein LOC116248951 isoform X1 [Nymphaea colorata]XP_031477859.1 uncharacterized protein LOC116248951 isoform X1 [Nymphaea colorata]XP_031477860.1 uncharacterized protein LOC116248951 isoform X1 [Nymphaea colorata]
MLPSTAVAGTSSPTPFLNGMGRTNSRGEFEMELRNGSSGADATLNGIKSRLFRSLSGGCNSSCGQRSWRRSSFGIPRGINNHVDGDDEVKVELSHRSSDANVKLDGENTHPLHSFSRCTSNRKASSRRSSSSMPETNYQLDVDTLGSNEHRIIVDGSLFHDGNPRFGSISLRMDGDKSRRDTGKVAPDDVLMLTSGFCFQEGIQSSMQSPDSPINSDIVAIPTFSCNNDDKTFKPQTMVMQPSSSKVPKYILLTYLAVFGILGVLLRYRLQELFGPDIVKLTDVKSVLYTDLPANILGSFLMGWFGYVFKANIADVSEPLAVGLSTGLLGSLTTFSGWIQKMVNLATEGQWILCISGIILSVAATIGAFIIGICSAEPTGWILKRITGPVLTKRKRLHIALYWIIVIALCVVLLCLKFKPNERSKVLLACLFGPPGVWLRWFLGKRLNDKTFKSKQYIMWLPYGTLAANVGAVGIMAAVSTLDFVVKTKLLDTLLKAIQLGFLGCLSTVSTFVLEIFSLFEGSDLVDHQCDHSGDHQWRAIAYALLSVCLSFVLEILLYSIPVWTKGYAN